MKYIIGSFESVAGGKPRQNKLSSNKGATILIYHIHYLHTDSSGWYSPVSLALVLAASLEQPLDPIGSRQQSVAQ